MKYNPGPAPRELNIINLNANQLQNLINTAEAGLAFRPKLFGNDNSVDYAYNNAPEYINQLKKLWDFKIKNPDASEVETAKAMKESEDPLDLLIDIQNQYEYEQSNFMQAQTNREKTIERNLFQRWYEIIRQRVEPLYQGDWYVAWFKNGIFGGIIITGLSLTSTAICLSASPCREGIIKPLFQ